jgi:hypothetical protein
MWILPVSVENLFFLSAVETLHAQSAAPTNREELSDPAADAKAAREAAYEVYEKYAARGAAFEVNLSFEKAQPLHQEFGSRFRYRKQQLSPSNAAYAASGGETTRGFGGLSIGAARNRAAAQAMHYRASRPTTPRAPVPVVEAPAPTTHVSVTIQPPAANEAKVASLPSPPKLAVPGMKLPPLPQRPQPKSSPRSGGRKQPEPDPFSTLPTRNADYYLSIFDSAAREVRLLLESDAYPRYITGPLFAQLVSTLLLTERLHAEAATATADSSAPGGVSVPLLSVPQQQRSTLSMSFGGKSPVNSQLVPSH